MGIKNWDSFNESKSSILDRIVEAWKFVEDVFVDLEDTNFEISDGMYANPNIQFRLKDINIPSSGDVANRVLSIHNFSKLGDLSDIPRKSKLFPGILDEPQPLKYCFSDTSEVVKSHDLVNDIQSVSPDKVKSFYTIVVKPTKRTEGKDRYRNTSTFRIEDYFRDLDPLIRRCISNPYVKLYRLIWSDNTVLGIGGIYSKTRSLHGIRDVTYGGHIKIIFEYDN